MAPQRQPATPAQPPWTPQETERLFHFAASNTFVAHGTRRVDFEAVARALGRLLPPGAPGRRYEPVRRHYYDQLVRCGPLHL